MTCASCQESITDRAMKAKDQVMPIMMTRWMFLLCFWWNKAMNVKITWHLPPEITTNISVLPRAPFCLLWMPGKLAECPSLHQVRLYWLFSTLLYFFFCTKVKDFLESQLSKISLWTSMVLSRYLNPRRPASCSLIKCLQMPNPPQKKSTKYFQNSFKIANSWQVSPTVTWYLCIAFCPQGRRSCEL